MTCTPKRAIACALLLFAGLPACDGGGDTPAAGTPAKKPAKPGADEATGEAEDGPAEQPGAGRAAPRVKEHAVTAAGRLGSTPEGVGLPPGTRAPDVELSNADGADVRLQDVTRGKTTLLVFYRGGWCPYCNFQIRELTTAYPKFQAKGVQPVAISVDRVEEAARTRALYDIPFPVLADPDLSAHAAFNVTHQVDDTELQRLKGLGIDLEKSSGRTHHRIAIPSIFIIDRQGTIRWSHADPDYKTRPSIDQLLAVIDGLNAAGEPTAP
ncbi:MAG: peroxiredoxin-like family protein [Myxococcales bacterium]|jgi:peroxiredoxin